MEEAVKEIRGGEGGGGGGKGPPAVGGGQAGLGAGRVRIWRSAGAAKI